MAKKFRYNPPINTPFKETSYFWYRNGKFHDGLDLAPLAGHDGLLRYIADGRVDKVGYDSVSGHYVWYTIDLWDNRKWRIYYGHMAEPSPNKEGDRVECGQWAGIIGQTGSATGRHVHIMVEVDWRIDGLQDYIRTDPKLALDQLELVAKAKALGY